MTASLLGTLEQHDNVVHKMAQFSNDTGDSISTAARQTALEATGAFSISGWFIPSNMGLYVHRVCGVFPLSSGQQQWVLQLNNPGGTAVGVSGNLRFLIFTNASNFIYIESQNLLPRNRPVHFVCTWDGVNAAGMDMYLTGVKESSPVRNTTGTFSGAYSDAGLRFVMGRFDTAKLRGNVRNLARWGKKLSDAEALEAYNGGKPKENSLLSFYADITADWPLQADTNCLNNATFNLSASGVTFISKALNTRSKNISFKKAQQNNTRYVAFGGLIRISATLAYWIGRSATSHVLNGKIVKIAIHLDTQVVDAPVDIITDGTYDLRGGTAAVIDGKIFVFTSRYNGGTDTFIDAMMYESTDGLTGETYAAGVALGVTTETRFNYYGEALAGFSAGEYFVPFHGSISGATWVVSYMRTTDNGANWSKVSVYSGTDRLVEPSFFKTLDNRLFFLARRNIAPWGLVHIKSDVGATTWDAPEDTNLGGAGAACSCMVMTDLGDVTTIFMNRGVYELLPAGFIFASRNNNVSNVLANPTQYNIATRIASSYDTDSLTILGYPNALNLGNNQFVVTYSAESASGVADLYVGFGEIRVA